ncbi:type II toxin-antitoxin system HicB family antitoxin [Nonomuraea recticatena]|uniref:Uncharacterized protein n=1 Tax=Nonomuraea recticatena TaxID=46178 RepID=A0ABP6FH60_9ACTN
MTSRHELIFDQPDISEDLDSTEPEIVATTYLATATRTGKYWTATVHGLPDRHNLQVQGATWKETKSNVLDRTVDLLGSDAGVVGVLLVPADAEEASALEAVRDARAARLLAEQAERDAVRTAAQTLLDRGWSTRDAGSALGLSHQRISQLAPRVTA